jgi:hypothetical protein
MNARMIVDVFFFATIIVIPIEMGNLIIVVVIPTLSE